MAILGYIVQYDKEDDFTSYHGFVKLFRQFSDAVAHAEEMYRDYLHHTDGAIDQHFEIYRPTKRDCDERGSVVVFRGSEYLIWIDCVVD
jgi:hypothetical protein